MPSAITFNIPAINDLTDVVITAAAAGDILRFDGFNWVDYPDSNYSPVAGSASIVTVGSIATGEWHGTTIAVDHGGTGLASYAVGDLIYASAGTTLAKLADVAVGAYLRSGGVTTAPLWSTLTLPNTGTAYRLPVFSATNVMTELAAVGATGEYLAGATGAIPSWATLN
jgi:hypothetical protein